MNNQNEAPSLLHLAGRSSNHWIGLKLEGVKSNRSAIGARVRVMAGGLVQTAEVRSGGSYLSQSDLRHFGLGSAVKVDKVEIVLARRRNASRVRIIRRSHYFDSPALTHRHRVAQVLLATAALPSVNIIVRFASTPDHDCVSPMGQRTSIRFTFFEFPRPK